MLRPLDDPARGVLRGGSSPQVPGAWQLHRWEPSELLRPTASHHWSVQWKLEPGCSHAQAVLSHPSVHLVVEEGQLRVYGPVARRFDRTMSGSGRVVATALRPGVVRSFVDVPVRDLVDKVAPAERWLGDPACELAAAVGAEGDVADAAAVLDAGLLALLPGRLDAKAELAARLMDEVGADRGLVRVGELARRLRISARSLHRLCHDYLGLSAHTIVCRQRLQEVALHAESGAHVDWTRLADELGYADQAHLIREFTATVGTSPARYATTARKC